MQSNDLQPDGAQTTPTQRTDMRAQRQQASKQCIVPSLDAHAPPTVLEEALRHMQVCARI
eukprot:9785908-Karenia_brevis.AAC.1